MSPRVRIASLRASALSVPLVEPFVIASGRIDVTRAALVEVSLIDDATATRYGGLGEAAALPPVTREDQPEVLRSLDEARGRLEGASLDASPAGLDELAGRLDDAFVEAPVARAGVETAFLDALARAHGVPVRALLGGALGAATRTLVTDVTIPIGSATHMAALARTWRSRGFRAFKVKIGKHVDDDVRALEAIVRAVPDATLRLDANAGFCAADAIALLRAVERLGAPIECFEQPCAADDLDGMAAVAAAVATEVIADESVRTLEDLRRVLAARAADGVNLKLSKAGGPLRSLAIGHAARAAGLSLMIGGMIETRLGMTAAAHVAAALGGVELVDLDTAWLLAGDPFEGGYAARGPHYTLGDAPGLDVRVVAHAIAP